MRGITLILTGNDADRARAGIELVGANAALGGISHIHFDRAATPLLNDAVVRELLHEIIVTGASLSICPTGVADYGVDMKSLPPEAEFFGLVGLMSSMDDDARLIAL